jgi:pyruvate kinase
MLAHAFAARGGALAPPSAQAARAKATRRLPDFARSNRRAPLSSGFPHAVSRRAATAARVLSSGKDLDLCDPAALPGPNSPLFTMDISTPTVLTSDLASVMEPPMCRLAPKKTHIICTLGPSSRSVEDLENLLQAGMSVARFNFSHGTHEYHLETLENLRLACANTGRICAVLLDTKGPEIRTGALRDGEPVRLRRGSKIELTTDYTHVGTSERIAISYEHLARDVTQGDTILMSDGNVMMQVLETDVERGTVSCECLNDATLGERKNCNLPGVTVDLPTMTEKDINDIVGFGVVNDVDFIAASFVRKASDVAKIRETLRDAGGESIKIISKVENYEGLCNYDAILAASDGIMVARGDLGMEIPLERIFWVQKMMIRKANLAGKPVITATQMLDSMIAAPRPTRAEATDVANAVLDGTDCVMLSGETAAGAYPREAVEIMSGICEEAEQCVDNYALSKSLLNVTLADVGGAPLSTIEALASSTVMTAAKTKAACIVVLAANGEAARMIAKYRPAVPIVVGVVPREQRGSIGFAEQTLPGRQVARQLMLTRGLIPTVVNVPEDHERAFTSDKAESEAPAAAKRCVMAAVRHARRQMLCRPGDKVVAMYNVERRCAVIRVIEVTDEMLDEPREGEGLVNEPAVLDPGVVPVE